MSDATKRKQKIKSYTKHLDFIFPHRTELLTPLKHDRTQNEEWFLIHTRLKKYHTKTRTLFREAATFHVFLMIHSSHFAAFSSFKHTHIHHVRDRDRRTHISFAMHTTYDCRPFFVYPFTRGANCVRFLHKYQQLIRHQQTSPTDKVFVFTREHEANKILTLSANKLALFINTYIIQINKISTYLICSHTSNPKCLSTSSSRA